MNRRNIDILVALGFTALAMLVVLAGMPHGLLRAIVTLPMVIFFPGYVLSLALFPDREALDGTARAATVVALNLACSVVGGLVLHLSPWGLQPGAWALWLGLVIWSGSMATIVRRRRVPQTRDPVLRRPPTNRLLALGMVAMLGATALLIAIVGTVTPRSEPFTQLWLLPEVPQGSPTVRIGVHNGEGTEIEYRLVLLADTVIVEEWPRVVLARGETAEWLVASDEFADAAEIRAELYLTRSPGEAYRHVHLRGWPPEPSPGP
jgi:uncharacterized membrane protein